jgi:hypothetical protein
LISSLYCFFLFRNQKHYREEIKNSIEKKSKTVQRRNQKQYREEIKNSTEKKSKTVQREEIKNSTEKK